MGIEAGRVGGVVYRGGGAGKAGNALKVKWIVQGGACLNGRKHGMDRYQNRALAWGQPEWVNLVRNVIQRLRRSAKRSRAAWTRSDS